MATTKRSAPKAWKEKPNVVPIDALAKEMPKKWQDALAKLGARRGDGKPSRVDVLYACIATGMSGEEAVTVWRRVYPQASLSAARCSYPGGKARATAERIFAVAGLANGTRPKAKSNAKSRKGRQLKAKR